MYSMLVVMLALMGPVQLSLAGAVPHGRVRSLAYSSAATANHSGTKMLMADSLPAADLANQLLRRQWKPPTTTTTPSATVSIETLPGYWLKDGVRMTSNEAHGVDYRTERYRLDDLLKQNTDESFM